jgi:hypothetical protein
MRKRVMGGKGAQNPNATLTEAQVIVIKHLNKNHYWKVRKLLRVFPQISQAQMYNILSGVSWGHIQL